MGTAEVFAQVERERRELARRLHDTLGQTLTSLVFAIDAAEAASVGTTPGARLSAIRAHSLKLIEELRDAIEFAERSSPPQVGIRHLPALLDDARKAGLDLAFVCDVDLRSVPDAIGTCVHHVVHESLLNVMRHAGTSRASISLRSDGPVLECVVADEGRGFDPATLGPAGWGRFGLRMMRQRVQEMQGTVVLASAPGRGTRITVRLPSHASRKGDDVETRARRPR